MQHNGCAIAASALRDEVMEVALQCPHESLVSGQHLRGEATVATMLHLLQIGSLEACLRVPQINIVLALVAEEEGGASVGAQQHSLFAIGLRSHIDDGASALSHSQIFTLDGVQSGGAKVAEEECGGAIGFGRQRHVEHIVRGRRGTRQHNAI